MVVQDDFAAGLAAELGPEVVQEAPELLIKLSLSKGKRILVHGDPRYFPAFADAQECELAEEIPRLGAALH